MKGVRGMSNTIYRAQVNDIEPAITSQRWPDPSYMYLERVPTVWLSDDEIAAGLRLEHLDTTTPFHEWERGRIFCADSELRWEKVDGTFWMVYVGPEPAPPGFALADELDLSHTTAQPRSYYLWGTHVSADKLEEIGTQARPESELFIEFRIPRLLYYPVSKHVKQVKLHVIEYLDPHTGNLLYYRFSSLEEA